MRLLSPHGRAQPARLLQLDYTMLPRRRFLGIYSALLATSGAAALVRAQTPQHSAWLPLMVERDPLGDAPIVGPASGTTSQAITWLTARSNQYTPYDISVIVDAYARWGTYGGVDWFLAIAQMCHETGSLTSWWCARPRRNPAGIGVTGQVQAGTPDAPPGPAWAWDGTQWQEGVSFATWADDAVPAHLGRLLAYALVDHEANEAQRTLIDIALGYRPLPSSYRGIAPRIFGLNGRWAVPGTEYGQRIVALAQRMRSG